jgi:nitrogen regulatory protein PII
VDIVASVASAGGVTDNGIFLFDVAEAIAIRSGVRNASANHRTAA